MKAKSSIQIPEFEQRVTIQDFARGILGISDIAGHLSGLYDGLKNKSSDSILTWHARQMSVSLRSILVENKGRLFTRVWKDGLFATWRQVEGKVLSKAVVKASPQMQIDYTIEGSEEQRTLKTPEYKHGFLLTALPGIGRSGSNRYAILGNEEIWTDKETVKLQKWLEQQLFEVDGLVYDVENAIKTVADKEGAHIDQIVDSEGIYAGNRDDIKTKFTNSDAYVRSRLVKFGPFSYPHIVVILVSKYLLMTTKESLTRSESQVQSIERQITLSSASLSAIRERIEMITSCPAIGRIDGLPLQVRPERLVMRPPISIGLGSHEEEQARANNLPQYGETYMGIPRRG